MPDIKGRMSDKEKSFISAYVATGDRAYSAAQAGYVQPATAASKLLANPHIRDAVEARINALGDDAAELAMRFIVTTLTDEKAAGSLRMTAAKLALGDYRTRKGVESAGKDPSEMTGEELAARIERLRQEASERAIPVIEGELAKADDAPEPDAFG